MRKERASERACVYVYTYTYIHLHICMYTIFKREQDKREVTESKKL